MSKLLAEPKASPSDCHKPRNDGPPISRQRRRLAPAAYASARRREPRVDQSRSRLPSYGESYGVGEADCSVQPVHDALGPLGRAERKAASSPATQR
jgi:hypothetical protein